MQKLIVIIARKFSYFALIFVIQLLSCMTSNSRLFDSGIDLMDKDKFSEATKIFSEIIESDDSFEAAYLYRGLCFHQLKKYELAVKDFNYLIKLHPQESIKKNPMSTKTYGERNSTKVEYVDAYFQRGVTRYFIDSLNAAKLDFEFVLSQSNRIAICRDYLANIYYLQGDLQNACAQIKLVEGMKTNDVDVQLIAQLKEKYCQ